MDGNRFEEKVLFALYLACIGKRLKKKTSKSLSVEDNVDLGADIYKSVNKTASVKGVSWSGLSGNSVVTISLTLGSDTKSIEFSSNGIKEVTLNSNILTNVLKYKVGEKTGSIKLPCNTKYAVVTVKVYNFGWEPVPNLGAFQVTATADITANIKCSELVLTI